MGAEPRNGYPFLARQATSPHERRMVRAIRGGNRTPNEDTDTSSWATVPTGPRDDASVISVATFRSTAEAIGSRLREIGHDHLAHHGISG